MDWIEFSIDAAIRLKGNAKKIIQTLGNCNDDFFKRDERPMRTRFIKTTLVKLGHKLNYKVYANSLGTDDLAEINRPFVNREWLFDIHWYLEGKEPYSIKSLPLVVECEWNPRRKGDSKTPFSGFKYDFQKLVVSNAKLRLMIFKIKKIEDLNTLGKYFENVINNYQHLENSAQFLFVAYDDQIKGFHYKEIIRF